MGWTYPLCPDRPSAISEVEIDCMPQLPTHLNLAESPDMVEVQNSMYHVEHFEAQLL